MVDKGAEEEHLCSKQPHSKDIERLPFHVLRSHVDDAGQPKLGTHCRLQNGTQ